MRISQIKQSAVIMAMLVALGACAASDVPLAKSTAGRNPALAEVPDPEETVRGATDPAITTLDLNNALHEQRLTLTDKLPSALMIPRTNLNAVPVTAALQAVLSGTDISLAWNAGAMSKRLVSIMNLSGPLPKVVEKICAAAKVFCDYRHGSLELSEKETFIVGLPPVVRAVTGGSGGGASNSMVEAINQLLGTDKAQVDDQAGNIIYTTTVDGEELVGQYLQQLRTGRPLVVLQMYIWEVTLNRENAQGINWSEFQNNTIRSLGLSSSQSLGSLAATTGSVSIGAVTSGIITSSSVISFLQTKGRVQTISSPQVTFVSGTNAELKVGGTQRYISQVGTNLSNVSGTSVANASTNTVSTDSIDTGLTIDIAGSYENGLVFANLELALKNLVSLNPTTSSGETIDLPQTTDEKMSTVLRVRPGDSLVLAGLVSSSDNSNGQGLPLGNDDALPLYGDNQIVNHELVMIVKPSIVLFSDQKAAEEKKRKDAADLLPEPVVIDKDGSRSLPLVASVKPLASTAQPLPATQAIPASAPTPLLSVQQASYERFAGPATSGADTGGTGINGAAASSDDNVVNRSLMQRGFSQAFDQLKQSREEGEQ